MLFCSARLSFSPFADNTLPFLVPLLTGEKKKMVETKRMEEVSQDKRRLRKVLKRKDQAEKKKSIKTAPPRRQT